MARVWLDADTELEVDFPTALRRIAAGGRTLAGDHAVWCSGRQMLAYIVAELAAVVVCGPISLWYLTSVC